MNITGQELEKEIYEFVDQVKELLMPEIWDTLLLNCSKNEALVLWLLYRQSEVNMSDVAEYIHVPLNTATGIISRMEKKQLVKRNRSEIDKRVVTIELSDLGEQQMKALIKEFSYYLMQIVNAFSQEEMDLFLRMMTKVRDIMKQERKREDQKPKIRKIQID